jgi:hypothetical protein
MKFQPLLLVVAFTVSSPTFVASQNVQPANCHTPESSGNFIGSDETIVNGMVCKMAQSQTTQRQVVAQPSAPAGASGQSQPAQAQATDMTNSRGSTCLRWG